MPKPPTSRTPTRQRPLVSAKDAAASGPLNVQEARFVDEYLLDLNGKDAAIRAGYTAAGAKQRAYELLNRPRVLAALQARMQARSERVQMDADYVLTKLRDNLERAMQAEPVRDKEGNAIGDYRYEGAVANGALKMLGDHLGLWRLAGDRPGKVPLTKAQATAKVIDLLEAARAKKARAS